MYGLFRWYKEIGAENAVTEKRNVIRFDMYFAKDSEYNDIREKSFCQWLDEMEKHEDVAVRCGVRLARDYMEYLKEENKKLQEENELKNSYLKKLAGR